MALPKLSVFGYIAIALAAAITLFGPMSAHAAPFQQNQVISTPFGGPGFIVSTSTSGLAALGATTTPYFSSFYATLGNITQLCLSGDCRTAWPTGTPGGLNTQVQYNNAGAFGGVSGATTNGTILSLTNPLLGGATLTTSSVNGVTLTTGGAATSFLNAAGSYSVPAGSGGGTGTVSTSSSETATYVPFWTSTNGTPALLSGGIAGFTFNSAENRLTVTNASTTAITALVANIGTLTLTNPLTVPNGGTGTSTAGIQGQNWMVDSGGGFIATSTIFTSTASNVGIGTTSPGYKLGVFGSASFGNSVTTTRRADFDTSGRLTFTYNDNSIPSYVRFNNYAVNGSGQGGEIFTVGLASTTPSDPSVNRGAVVRVLTESDYTTAALSNSTMTFSVQQGGGLSEKFRITSTGASGFNDSSPDYRLEAVGSVGSGYFGLTNSVDGDVFSVIANGNVGVGSTTPGSLLSIGTTLGANFTGTSATSTLGGPLRSTCFTTDGTTCLSTGGASLVGTTGQVPYFSGTNTAVGTSSLVINTKQQVLNSQGDIFSQASTYIVSTTTANGQFTDVQSAINALPSTGGKIHIRCGVYTLPTATYGILVKVANTVIEGEGNCTQLNLDRANTANAFGMNAVALAGIELSNVYFHQTNATFGSIGVNASNTPLISVHDIKFDGFATTTSSTDSVNVTFYQNFQNLDMRDNTSCIQIGSPTSNPVNDSTYGGYLRCAPHSGNGGNGIYIDANTVNGSQALNIQNFNSEPTGAATGITAINAPTGIDVTFTNPYVEGNAIGYKLGANSQRITFLGGEFLSNTTYTNAGSNNQWLGVDKEGQAFQLIQASSTIADVSGNDASVPSLSFIGNTNFAKTSNAINIAFANSTDSGVPLLITNPGTGTTTRLINTGTGKSFEVDDQANDTSPFVIDAAGLVGVGTTSPFAALAIGAPSSTINPFAVATSTAAGTQVFMIDQGGHHLTSGPAPKANSCVGFAITGDDETGAVTFTAATSCSITFAKAYAKTPVCLITATSLIASDVSAISTTGFTVTGLSAISGFNYICQQHN